MLLGRCGTRERGDRVGELGFRFDGVVAIEDPCGLLHLLSERAVRARSAVGGAAATDHTRALSGHELREFECDARLPDARRSKHGREVASPLVDDAIPDADEHTELAVSADHRYGPRGPLPDGGGGPKGEPGLNRSLLSLRHDRLGGPVLDRPARAHVGLFTDEHGPYGRCGLKTGSGIHNVPCDERLTAVGVRIEGDDRLARVHGDTKLKTLVLRPVSHCEGSAHCPLGIVAVCDWGAEHAHHGVADELLDLATMTFELATDMLVVRDQECSDILGIQLLRARREPHEIDEQDRDEAPLLTWPTGSGECGPAGVAEFRAFGVLLAASCAGEHECKTRVRPCSRRGLSSAGPSGWSRRRTGSLPRAGWRCSSAAATRSMRLSRPGSSCRSSSPT